jgi:hypothetical protein
LLMITTHLSFHYFKYLDFLYRYPSLSTTGISMGL